MMGHQPVSAAPLSTPPEVVAIGVYRPASDLLVAGWSAVPGPELYATLDEAVANDADYVSSPALGGGSPATLGFNAPLPAGMYTLRIRARSVGSTGQARVQLLDASNTAQGSSAWQALTASFATYELSITTTGTSARLQLEVQA
jgi:hypothetical protein